MPGHFVKSKNTTEGILNHVLHESIDQLISTARLKLVDRSFMDVNSFLRRKKKLYKFFFSRIRRRAAHFCIKKENSFKLHQRAVV